MDGLILAGLSLRQLRLVQALGDLGQMQRAADYLRISQPAASKLLSQTEAVVRAKLFDRRPRGLLPTAYGEILLRRTRVLLIEIGLAGEEINALRSGGGGRVAVGSVMEPAVETVAAAVARLRDSQPRLRIAFEIDTSEALVSRLLDGELDLCVARIPLDADAGLFLYDELSRERACLIVRDGHPLSGRTDWPMDATTDYTWILQHRGSPLRRSLEALLRRRGAPLPDRVVETSSFLAMILLLSNSDAVAPVVLSCAQLLLKLGRFRTLELPEPLLVEPYGLIRIKERPFSPAVVAFCAQLKADFARSAAEA